MKQPSIQYNIDKLHKDDNKAETHANTGKEILIQMMTATLMMSPTTNNTHANNSTTSDDINCNSMYGVVDVMMMPTIKTTIAPMTKR